MNLNEKKFFSLTNPSMYPIINIGSGVEISIYDLSKLIAHVAGFDGKIIFDDTKPDGTYRKLLSSDKISNLGWYPNVGLKEGIRITFENFVTKTKV